MRNMMLALAICAAAVLATGTSSADNKCVGAKKCGMCHKSAATGAAYTVWEKTAHANAFKTLQGNQAAEVAKKKGLKTSAADSPECLKCHVTPGGTDKTEGVTCEACHGGGAGYQMVHNKKDDASKAKAKEAGFIAAPDAKSCEVCHNAQSPTFKGFKFKEMWAKIEHKLPKK